MDELRLFLFPRCKYTGLPVQVNSSTSTQCYRTVSYYLYIIRIPILVPVQRTLHCTGTSTTAPGTSTKYDYKYQNLPVLLEREHSTVLTCENENRHD
jgi:hypothetical protein